MAEDFEANRPVGKASMKVTTILVTPLAGQDPPQLLLEVEIDCAVCGQSGFRLAGHHVTVLLEALKEASREYPKLVGVQGRAVSRLDWAGTVDPAKVGEN